MKLWLVTGIDCAGYECEPLPAPPFSVHASALDALGECERRAGGSNDGVFSVRERYLNLRFTIGGKTHSYDDFDREKTVTFEGEVEHKRYDRDQRRYVGTNTTYWSEIERWYIEEIELIEPACTSCSIADDFEPGEDHAG